MHPVHTLVVPERRQTHRGGFCGYHNNQRLHSAIGCITPKDKLQDRAETILAEGEARLIAAGRARKVERESVLSAGYPQDQ
jgi:hypothetical protein